MSKNSKKNKDSKNELTLYQLATKANDTTPEAALSHVELERRIIQAVDDKQDRKINEALARARAGNEYSIHQAIWNAVTLATHKYEFDTAESWQLVIPYVMSVKQDAQAEEITPDYTELENVFKEELTKQGLLPDTQFRLAHLFVDGNIVDQMSYSKWRELHTHLFHYFPGQFQSLQAEGDFALVKVNFLVALVDKQGPLLDTIYNSTDNANPVSQAMQAVTDKLNERYSALNWLMMFPNRPFVAVETGLTTRDNIIMDSFFNNFKDENEFSIVFFYLKEDKNQAAMSVWNKNTGALEVLAFVREPSLNLQVPGKMNQYKMHSVKFLNQPISMKNLDFSTMKLEQLMKMSQHTVFHGTPQPKVA